MFCNNVKIPTTYARVLYVDINDDIYPLKKEKNIKKSCNNSKLVSLVVVDMT